MKCHSSNPSAIWSSIPKPMTPATVPPEPCLVPSTRQITPPAFSPQIESVACSWCSWGSSHSPAEGWGISCAGAAMMESFGMKPLSSVACVQLWFNSNHTRQKIFNSCWIDSRWKCQESLPCSSWDPPDVNWYKLYLKKQCACHVTEKKWKWTQTAQS